MSDDLTRAAENALRSLDVPEDVAERHLARLLAPGTNWTQAPGTNWVEAPGTVWTQADVIPLRPRRTTLRAAAGGIAVTAVLMSGAGVAAASTSTPGDPLYGLKTARERVQLAMARPGDSRARLELKIARTRLGEAAALLRAGDPHRAVETLARADAALASAVAQGGDEVDADADAEIERRVEVLGALLDGGLPEQANDAAREALERALTRSRNTRHVPGTGRPEDKPAVRPTDRPGRPTDPPRDVPSANPSARPTVRPTPRSTTATQPQRPTGRPTQIPPVGGR